MSEKTTTSPASETVKKPRGFAAVKAKLQTRVEELEAQLAAQGGAPAEAPAPATPSPQAFGEYPDYNPADDPLIFIDYSVDAVFLVSRVFGFRGRREINDQRGSQDKTYLNADRSSRWAACPFDFTNDDPFKQKELEYLNKEWWVLTVSRIFAEDCFSGIEGMPKSAVVPAAAYGGLDAQTAQVRGPRTKPSADPLRELVRRLLQENPKTLWLNDDYGNYVADGIVKKARPNPYGEGIEAMALARSPRPAYDR